MPTSSDNLEVIAAFADVAAEFCALIDSLRDVRPEDLYVRMEAVLSRMQQAILPVRMEMGERESSADQHRIGPEEWKEIGDTIASAVHSEISVLVRWHAKMNPVEGEVDEEGVRAGMLWDDLADIYRDLHAGQTLWDRGTAGAPAGAAWEWRFGYENHWGHHLFRAMLTVHEIRYYLPED